jgi:hypothetical protein
VQTDHDPELSCPPFGAAARETSYQWGYARVGNDQAFEPRLGEALITYSDFSFLVDHEE